MAVQGGPNLRAPEAGIGANTIEPNTLEALLLNKGANPEEAKPAMFDMDAALLAVSGTHEIPILGVASDMLDHLG